MLDLSQRDGAQSRPSRWPLHKAYPARMAPRHTTYEEIYTEPSWHRPAAADTAVQVAADRPTAPSHPTRPNATASVTWSLRRGKQWMNAITSLEEEAGSAASKRVRRLIRATPRPQRRNRSHPSHLQGRDYVGFCRWRRERGECRPNLAPARAPDPPPLSGARPTGQGRCARPRQRPGFYSRRRAYA